MVEWRILVPCIVLLLAYNRLKTEVFTEQIFLYIEPFLESFFLHQSWINFWSQCLILLTVLTCIILLYYSIVLSLFNNGELYAVPLGKSLENVVNDIVELATEEEIRNFRQHMYQRGYIPQHFYNELLDQHVLSDHEQVKRIINLARRREPLRRLKVALMGVFNAMANDRNRCGEIAVRIWRRLNKWEKIKTGLIDLLYRFWIEIPAFCGKLASLTVAFVILKGQEFYFTHWGGAMAYLSVRNETFVRSGLNGRVFIVWENAIDLLENHYLPY